MRWIGICESSRALSFLPFFVPCFGHFTLASVHKRERESIPIHQFIFADGGRMAYIDSELAKRRQQQGGRSQPPPNTVATSTSSISPSAASPSRAHADDRGKLSDIQREPAALGKLLEIDLGDEARDRNVLRTEQARRRMGGEVVEDEEDAAAASKGKVRLGRDGKPWRGKKRRGSEDIKRDKLVEEFLRENRCEYFSCVGCFSPFSFGGRSSCFPMLMNIFLYSG